MALSPVLLRALTSAGSADTSVFTRSNSPALIAANRSGSVDSMMRRFYRDLKAALLAVAMIAGPASAAGQTASLPAQPLLGSALDAGMLRDLPIANNPFSVLETL